MSPNEDPLEDLSEGMEEFEKLSQKVTVIEVITDRVSEIMQNIVNDKEDFFFSLSISANLGNRVQEHLFQVSPVSIIETTKPDV